MMQQTNINLIKSVKTFDKHSFTGHRMSYTVVKHAARIASG